MKIEPGQVWHSQTNPERVLTIQEVNGSMVLGEGADGKQWKVLLDALTSHYALAGSVAAIIAHGPRAEYMWIDRAAAIAMLAKSTGNRGVGPQLVRKLCNALLCGDWKTTHQGVAFDINGRLIDGHHRLEAIVMASNTDPGIRVYMLVTTALPVDAIQATDTDMCVRTAGDTLTMIDGIQNARRVVAIARAILNIQDRFQRRAYSVAALRRVINETDAASIAWATAPGHSQFAACVWGTLAYAWHADKVKIDEFARQISTRENLSHGSPAIALLRFLGDANISGHKNMCDVQRRTLSAAWAHVRGKTIAHLYASGKGLKDSDGLAIAHFRQARIDAGFAG